jgi:predicted nucleic acid-binding protein
MSFLVDTDVLSQPAKPAPNNSVLTWIRQTDPGRILAVTSAIALDAGSLIAAAAKAGFTVLPMDALIAATARVHGFSVVTLNQKHFARLNVTIVKL